MCVRCWRSRVHRKTEIFTWRRFEPVWVWKGDLWWGEGRTRLMPLVFSAHLAVPAEL